MIKDSFQGQLQSTLVCSFCGAKRSVTESFLNISLQIEPSDAKLDKQTPVNTDPISPPTVGRPKSLRSKTSLEATTLDDSLSRFTSPETLCDMVSCVSCNAMRPVKKQLTLSKLPRVLCLHLKRFESRTNKKIVNPVRFPITGLDMGKFLPHWREIDDCEGDVELNADQEGSESEEQMEIEDGGDNDSLEKNSSAPVPPSTAVFPTHPKILYDLFGVVNHTGNLHQGHYVSIVKGNPLSGIGLRGSKNKEGSKNIWYLCGDAEVLEVEESLLTNDNVAAAAYMLFYQRREEA